ncbi:hypothetical protein JAAARDRAFT_31110 [Jaapia argillacea MUCL 33604]|uniref:Uncharacterized protein n=1 Tax=Jaapia argillacea MUCL 33604 TaxID=933084 RepID=A0A067QG94_9AGAM|nr:hypothetical protein JAAARDRAFT_31110 [Jaapia argillacea MUCL 33604]
MAFGARILKALFKTKGLWGLVSDMLPCPSPTVEGSPTGDEKELLRAWKVKVEEVTRLLWLALEDGQKVHVKGKEDDAVKFWKALQAVHLQQCPGTCFNAMNTFLSIRKLPDSWIQSPRSSSSVAMQSLMRDAFQHLINVFGVPTSKVSVPNDRPCIVELLDHGGDNDGVSKFQ